VVFWGQDGETRVRCEISREALDDHFHSENKDKLEVFRSTGVQSKRKRAVNTWRD